jgi:glycosyltransferase involved in cell wall biosynthesis
MVSDGSIAWYLVLGPWCRYDQDVLLRPRLAAIRRIYPRSRVMVQPSESSPKAVARWRGATADLALDWLAPRPIHTAGPGVNPIGAMLEAYLDDPRPADFLFKVDLDARVRRPFRWLPYGSEGIFGTLEFVAYSGFPYGDFPNVQGGCYGLGRETARRILDGGLLSGPELRDDPKAWVDGIADWRRFADRGGIGEDGLLRWVTKRMGIRPFAYGEIDSRFGQRPGNAYGDFAVTHPHKVLEPDEARVAPLGLTPRAGTLSPSPIVRDVSPPPAASGGQAPPPHSPRPVAGGKGPAIQDAGPAASRSARGGRALVSVIIPGFGPPASARQCVAALARHTPAPWELIVLDAGSIAGTADYLAGVRDAAAFPVTVLAGLDAPVARDSILRAARGEHLVLLDPDTVVTDAWLDQLVALAEADPKTGMVGPMSNIAPPHQLVADVPYADLEAMHAFAARWRREHRGRWQAVATLSRACLLIKRFVFESAGGHDGRPGSGLFDEEGLAMRVREAGYGLAVARDLFVHRSGGRTSGGAVAGADGLARESRARPIGNRGRETPPMGAVASMSGGTSTSTGARRARVSLTMIVRDEQDNLPACLASAAGLFDEVVVVDTGSTDHTADIARSLGARVSHFAWVDDFAAARNAALDRATGDYAFWLDADDRIEPPHHGKLKALLDGLEPGGPAYVVRCSCDAAPDGGGATVVDHVRLFPRLQGVRWEYRVHEQILPALRRAGVEVRWSDAVVRHVGYNDPALRRKKLERDRAILDRELADRPDHPFVLFNLGQVALEMGDPHAAIGFLTRSLARTAPGDSIAGKLHALVARAHQKLGETAEALAACAAGLAADPDDAELLFRKGVLHRLRGEPERARACWERVLTLRRPERFASLDEGIYGHVTHRNLATLAEEHGDRAAAAGHWAAVLAARPDDPDAGRALGRLGPIRATHQPCREAGRPRE